MNIYHRHTGIVVKNTDEMLAFYKGIGLEIISITREKREFISLLFGVDVRCDIEVYKLGRDGEIFIELLVIPKNYPEGPKALYSTGITHIALKVDDAQEMYQKIKNYGGEPITEPVLSPDKKHKLFFAKDPDENFIEIVQPLKPLNHGAKSD